METATYQGFQPHDKTIIFSSDNTEYFFTLRREDLDVNKLIHRRFDIRHPLDSPTKNVQQIYNVIENDDGSFHLTYAEPSENTHNIPFLSFSVTLIMPDNPNNQILSKYFRKFCTYFLDPNNTRAGGLAPQIRF